MASLRTPASNAFCASIRSSRAGRTPIRAAAAAEPKQAEDTGYVTVEFQRARAKEMTKYFNSLKAEKAAFENKTLGWTPKNEIGNGRWVMMGLAIGLLTEYATGYDFVDQIKYTLTILGVADLDLDL
ncbi:unnamed protein product [Pedinophyceae sp. YPF-701]|nr:unnamed protein product [Pedinophyceae sp. YPF-701]